MNKYKSLHRTTLDKMEGAPLVGVYVIAYMGAVLYVGKASRDIVDRLESHYRSVDRLGEWMRKVDDWPNVRVDVLEAPDVDVHTWLLDAESALIRKFNPLFNIHVHA